MTECAATQLVERMRAALMERHHDEWEMETVGRAAYLIARVVAMTGRAETDVLRDVDQAVSMFESEPVRRQVINALGRSLSDPSDAAQRERDGAAADVMWAVLTGMEPGSTRFLPDDTALVATERVMAAIADTGLAVTEASP